MKKILIIFLISFLTFNVYAKEKLPNIEEKKQIQLDPKNKIEKITIKYTIPKKYNKQKIKISLAPLKKISTNQISEDGLILKISIKNNSNKKYSYIDQSFNLTPEKLINNQREYLYSLRRTNNTAIQGLYKTSKLTKEMATDKSLNKVLKSIGYSGVNELNIYYLDYYNQKYQQKAEKLEDFNNQIIKEIFNGKSLNEKETNAEILKLGYNWWYNHIVSLTFHGQDYSPESSQNTSISSYEKNKNLANNYLTNAFTNLKKETRNLETIYIKKSTNIDAFKDYQINIKISFELIQQT